MKKPQEKKSEPRPIPFDEALRRLVNAPPKHKPAKKPDERKRPDKKE